MFSFFTLLTARMPCMHKRGAIIILLDFGLLTFNILAKILSFQTLMPTRVKNVSDALFAMIHIFV